MQFRYRTDIKFTPPVCKSLRSYKDAAVQAERHYTTLLPSGAGHYSFLVKSLTGPSQAVNDVQTVELFGNFESRERGSKTADALSPPRSASQRCSSGRGSRFTAALAIVVICQPDTDLRTLSSTSSSLSSVVSCPY